MAVITQAKTQISKPLMAMTLFELLVMFQTPISISAVETITWTSRARSLIHMYPLMNLEPTAATIFYV